MNFLKTGALLFALALLAACSSNEAKQGAPAAVDPAVARERALHRIDSLEARVQDALKSPERQPDIKLAMYLIQAYQYFAHDYPTDPRSPEALDRAGQLYSGVLNDPEHAIALYEQAYQNYPKYKNRPTLLFQEAAAYDALHDTTATVGTYTRFLLAYPGHPLAAEAKGLIKFARMSAAEQKEFFRSKDPAAQAARQ